VTRDCVSASRERALAIDADVGTVDVISNCSTASEPVVVEASAPGLGAVRASIPTSTDAAKDGVLAVAKATATHFAGGFSYLADFQG